MLRDSAGQEREEVFKRKGDLEIEEDIIVQRRLWAVQRYARLVAVVLLFCALTGVLGGGPMSRRVISLRGGSVEYERIGYDETSQSLRVKLGPSPTRHGKVRIVLDHSSLHPYEVEQILPQPSASLLEQGKIIFEFQSAGGLNEIVFDLRPTTFGLHTMRVGLDNNPPIDLVQLVLP